MHSLFLRRATLRSNYSTETSYGMFQILLLLRADVTFFSCLNVVKQFKHVFRFVAWGRDGVLE